MPHFTLLSIDSLTYAVRENKVATDTLESAVRYVEIMLETETDSTEMLIYTKDGDVVQRKPRAKTAFDLTESKLFAK